VRPVKVSHRPPERLRGKAVMLARGNRLQLAEFLVQGAGARGGQPHWLLSLWLGMKALRQGGSLEQAAAGLIEGDPGDGHVVKVLSRSKTSY